MEKDIKIDKELISYCGPCCAACGKYLKGKSPGCRENEKATWCKIRKCSAAHGYHTCAECAMNVVTCETYSNFMGKLFGLIFRSDRKACIDKLCTYC